MCIKLCVIGLGYIGLPTAAMFASNGYKVVGVDINEELVVSLQKGTVYANEPDLRQLVEETLNLGNLIVSTICEKADIYIITVPTPLTIDNKANMCYVIQALENILPYIEAGNTLILESTIGVGTMNDLVYPLLAQAGLNIEELYIGYCPERVLPGKILNELVYNSRLIGGMNRKSSEKIRDIYASFVKGELYITEAKTAEICKIMENVYRDVNIALANELMKACESLEINVWDVITLCNKHPRVNIHVPGPGVGGHCLTIDPWFLVEKCPSSTTLIKRARQINDNMPNYIFEKIEQIIGKQVQQTKITLLGMTYKANIEDIRESPIIKLIEQLEYNGYEVVVVDPYVTSYKNIDKNIERACTNSSLLILAVDHTCFKKLSLSELGQVMKQKNILDTRKYWDEEYVKTLGFQYTLLGDK